MTKSKGRKEYEREVKGEWLKHMREIAKAKSARKTESSRDNLAKAREAKMMKRLGIKSAP